MPSGRRPTPAREGRPRARGPGPDRPGLPRPGPATLARPRLDAALDAALARPLTLVIAPAGAGKTVALATWAARSAAPVAWWTARDEDGWLADLLAALAAARPELAPPHPPGPAADPSSWLSRHVIIPMSRESCPLVLVIDEVERALAPAPWRALAWLIDHQPPALRLVLAGRVLPPLALARREAAGEVARIDAAALAFDAREAAAACERLVGRELDPDARAWIFARTRGWPAGVRLLAHGFADGPPARVDGPPLDRRALDFLVEEVLARQPAPRRRFLLATAIVDELDPDLCAALTGRDDAGDELGRLVDEGLFVEQSEGRGDRPRLRYHPLFAAMLAKNMSFEPDLDRAALHARAARWYAARGHLERAVRHCELAADPALAAELAVGHGFSLVRARALGELGRLVAVAGTPTDPAREPFVAGTPPESACEPLVALAGAPPKSAREPLVALAGTPPRATRELLATLAAWAALPHGRAPTHAALALARDALARRATALARDAAEPAAPPLSTLTGSLDCLEAFLELRAGSPELGLVRARAVLSTLGADSRGLVVALHLAAGLAAELLQRLPEALQELECAAAAASRAPVMPSLLPALAHRVRVLRRTGRLTEAASAAEAAAEVAVAHGWGDGAGAGEAAIERAIVLHARGAFAEAEALLLDGLARVRLGDDRGDVVRGATALARLRRDRDDPSGARDAADEAIQAAADLEPWLRALARIARDSAQADLDPPDGPHARLVRTEARLAAAEEALRAPDGALDPRPCARALADEQTEAEASGRGHDAIEAGVLRAALLAARDPPAAASILEDMSLRACPEDHRRPFLVHQRHLRPLLGRLAAPARDALHALLAAAPAAAAGPVLLTAREREILAGIALGLSNQMIAHRLFISLATVKTHVRNVFTKLGVDNRTAAVRRGRGLGLVGDD